MTATVPGRLRGRLLALLGILLVALNVRTAVSALSPIVDRISADVPLDELGLGIIGMLPAVAFAVAALAAAPVARAIGIELTMVIACAAMVAGPLLRSFAGGYGPLVIGSAVALLGMGFANVVLPPAVKKYFPDRIGLLTGAYVSLLAISTTLGAALAEPVAATAGWRISLGMWAVIALVAMLPWVGLLRGRGRTDGDASVIPEAHLAAPVWRSAVARQLALLMVVTALSTYAMFAWLPTVLVQHSGSTALEGGGLLAMYSILGLPLALTVPLVAARLRNVSWIIVLGVVAIVVFCAGLILFPGPLNWLWVGIGGVGGVLFPLVLVLINLRTRTTAGSVATSALVQSVGYAGGALGPLLMAVAHDLTGGWVLPLLLMLVSALVGLIPAVTLAKPRFVEDELAEHAGGAR